jgi:subtilisin family serine protease
MSFTVDMPGEGDGFGAETTGRYLVLFEDDAIDAGTKALARSAGIKTLSSASTDEGFFAAEELEERDGLVFAELGVAVVRAEPDQLQAVAAADEEQAAIVAIEPERIVRAVDAVLGLAEAEAPAALSPEYLRGYRDAVLSLTAAAGANVLPAPPAVALTWDESEATWGLQATRVPNSRFSGRGVAVAVLDTGMDLQHPDFARRAIASRSFVAGQAVQDGHGHGTHCIGTALGPQRPGSLPRYGVAYRGRIFAGKVLSNEGFGRDGGILNGIQWALQNKCRVVSMSLGAPTVPGQSFSAVFERVARRAMAAGTLIIAAADNASNRAAGRIRPVAHPANCPSIMAVGALDDQLRVANFSDRGLNPNGGQVDIAAPGVRVRSSWPRPVRYNTLNGTSMATPHVAGIAALLAEANRRATPAELWSLLTRTARRLPLSAADIGAGLVQAP